ncbi:sulfotransferase [Streptomyces sp. NPDC093089]|uniref:sulfotransferase n=1 Tax=Streptomyces sp. NPDC093089 TaxID=3366024 RepID=UPI0038171BAA
MSGGPCATNQPGRRSGSRSSSTWRQAGHLGGRASTPGLRLRSTGPPKRPGESSRIFCPVAKVVLTGREPEAWYASFAPTISVAMGTKSLRMAP